MKKAILTFSIIATTGILLSSCGGNVTKESSSSNDPSSNDVTIGSVTKESSSTNDPYSCDSQTKTSDMTDLQFDSIFIIPQNDKSLICKIENNDVRELGSFPKSIDSKSIIVNNEFICSIDSLISVFDIKGNLLKEIISDFELTSLNSKNKVVYFGGKSSKN